jgi:hypothetical protein
MQPTQPPPPPPAVLRCTAGMMPRRPPRGSSATETRRAGGVECCSAGCGHEQQRAKRPEGLALSLKLELPIASRSGTGITNPAFASERAAETPGLADDDVADAEAAACASAPLATTNARTAPATGNKMVSRERRRISRFVCAMGWWWSRRATEQGRALQANLCGRGSLRTARPRSTLRTKPAGRAGHCIAPN